jgi:hypothetical protein
MSLLISLYVITALISGGFAMFSLGFGPGIAGALAPLIAVIGGGGITTPGSKGFSKLATIFVGLAFLALSIIWLRAVEWQLDFFGWQLSGTFQAAVGFGLGLGFGLSDRGERGLLTGRQSQVDT